MKTVIMAGGRGTRIASVAGDVPKPMIKIHGKPILQYEIECLKKQGLTDIILIIGHLGDVIKEYFSDGSAFGVHIEYIQETAPLGTAGGLWFLKDRMEEEFLLLNGDIIFDVDFNRFLQYHKQTGCVATILTHPNGHPYDSGIIMADERNIVTNWLHKEDDRTIYKNRVNAGIHILSPEIFKMFGERPKKKDLDRDILKMLIPLKKLAAYDSPEYVKDMGTPDRYYRVAEDIKSGLVEAKNLNRRQKAVFLDRDGTINVYKGFIRSPDDLELMDGAAEAIKRLNESRYLVIVITNQPVIARGECTCKELDMIHAKLETLLGAEGAYMDDLFYCPHHPDKGFEGEVKELKTECECRKPKPGLLFKAAEKYNIDISQSYMIGDSERDVQAGEAAGCKASYRIDGNYSLYDRVNIILSGENQMEQKITAILDDLLSGYPVLSNQKDSIWNAYKILETSFSQGNKLLVAGNGGSAADAEHIVGELMKGFVKKRPLDEEALLNLSEADAQEGRLIGEKLQGALPAIALANHAALSTAFLNDVDPLLGFAQQVNGYGKEGDVFLGISTSGNSKNILAACTVAKAKNMKVIGLTGKDGGKLKEKADITITVNERETYKIQELHLPIYHALCLMLEERFFEE